MKNLGTQTIFTDRLILRKYTLEDAQDVYSNWASDDEVVQYLTWKKHADIDETRRIIKMWMTNYKNLDFYQWSIELKETSENIGSISVNSIDEKIEAGEIGYALSKKYWNCGIMTEALIGVLKFLFEEVKLNRIEVRHSTENPASGRVAEKCGMKYEGTLRQANFSNFGITDTKVYLMLRKEWSQK